MISAPSETLRDAEREHERRSPRDQGMVIATTRPARQPIEMNETTSTMRAPGRPRQARRWHR